MKGPGAHARECLEFGREAARVSCGIAYALDILSRPPPSPAEAVRTGIETARVFAGKAGERLPAAKKLAESIAKEAEAVGRAFERPDALTGKARKEIRGRLEALRGRAERLHAHGEQWCGA